MSEEIKDDKTESLEYLYSKKLFSFKSFSDLLYNSEVYDSIEKYKIQPYILFDIVYMLGKHEEEWKSKYKNIEYCYYDDLGILCGSTGILVICNGKPVDEAVILRS